jgi:UDP-glucose 4-epimerase
MHVLVTGGAGYIGSVVAEELLREGHAVSIVDDLSKGHRAAVPEGATFHHTAIHTREEVEKILSGARIDAVVHMAASSLVSESVASPARYYENNVVAMLLFLDAMRDAGVTKLVFSSTAAVYGEPEKQPIEEADRTMPSNPYGETKLAMERALAWYERAYGMRYASLRYFNAAGATRRCGEAHNPESHLIPIVLQVAMGQRQFVPLFGDDYPTRDGTCIRDYIHVVDLARAHIMALSILETKSEIYNLGCGGRGYSVREVVDAAARITGRKIPVQISPRRPGDPAILIASSDKIGAELSWKPQRQTLEQIIGSAWEWLQAHPRGYSPN